MYLGSFLNKSDYFTGSLREFRIWNKARTQSEIRADMSYLLEGNEEGLLGYWPLNEGSGNTVQDHSSNANNGTINGATWEKAEIPITNKPRRGGTGLEDYGYWYRWKQNLPQPTNNKPFRRGRIWA